MTDSDLTANRSVTIPNAEGIHVRAAHLIGIVAARYESKITLTKEHRTVEPTNILQVLSLGIAAGQVVELRATGRDASEAVEAIALLIEGGFQEEIPTNE